MSVKPKVKIHISVEVSNREPAAISRYAQARCIEFLKELSNDLPQCQYGVKSSWFDPTKEK